MKKVRILIVEDESIIAMETESVLIRLGYEVISIVDTGERAIEVSESQKPDIILMDIRIKGEMDGIETAEIIRTRFEIPVVFLTAYLDEIRLDKVKLTMPFGYILKPVQEKDLKVTLEMALHVSKVDIERRRVERELRDSYDIINSSPTVVFRWSIGDSSWPVEYVSENVEKLFGYTSEDFMSKKVSYTDTIHPDDLERVRNEISQFNENPDEEVLGHETYRIVTKSGEIKWIDDRTKITRNSDGEVTHYQGIVIDVTDREKSHESLKESEEKYKTITESANEGIVIIQDGLFKYVNPKMCQISGYSEEEFLNTPFTDYTHPDDLDMVTNRQRRRLLGEVFDENFVFRVLTKKQETKWLLFKSVTISWEGKPATLDFISDITKQKQTETDLRESEEKYRNILESMEEGYVEQDLKGNYTFFNDSFCRITGYSRDELHGTSYKEIWDLEGIREISQFYNNVYKTNEPNTYLDSVFTKKSGEKVDLECSVSLIKDNGGNSIGFRTVVRDITERKKIVQKLESSEKDYRSFIDNSPISIVVVRDTKVIYANQLALQESEYSIDEIVKLTFMELTAPNDLEETIYRWDKRGNNTNPDRTFDMSVISKSKKIKLAKVFYVEMVWEGEPAYLFFLNNITKRVIVEQSLKESEERFRALTEFSSDFIIILNTENVYTYINSAVKDTIGFSPEEVVGKTPKEFVHKDDLQRITGILEKSVGRPNEHFLLDDFRVRHKQSGFRHMTGTVVNMIDVPSVSGLVINLRNITEQRKVEQELKESEEKFRMVATMMKEGVVLSGKEMIPIWVNQKMCEISGFTEEELLDNQIVNLFEEENLSKVLENRTKILKGFPVTYEVTGKPKNGRSIDLLVSGSPIMENGKFVNSIAVFTDITHLKQQERLLEQKVDERTKELTIAKTEAEQANKLKSEFLANISHELRTPMHAILSYSNYGIEKFNRKDNERLIQYFKNINNSGNRLMGLLNDLLDLSKLQAEKMEYTRDKWSINSVFNDMKSEFSILGDEKNLSWKIQEIEETNVSFDIDKLKQVVSNLFSNSIRYSNENSVIEVSFEETSDLITVITKNEGVPIPTDELELIFDPFIQSSTTKTGAGGTGLGLPICRQIIEDHGGKIWAEDNPNGATFKFQLPKDLS